MGYAQSRATEAEAGAGAGGWREGAVLGLMGKCPHSQFFMKCPSEGGACAHSLCPQESLTMSLGLQTVPTQVSTPRSWGEVRLLP